MLDPSTELRLHSSIADSYPSYIRLWYLCRAIDFGACGRVKLDVNEAAQALAVSPRTIENYLKQGKKLYWRIIKTAPGKYTIWMKSLGRITLDRGLESFGTVAEATIEGLRNLRITATEIATLGLQANSYYQAKISGYKADEGKDEKRRGRSEKKPHNPARIAHKAEELFEGAGISDTDISAEESQPSQLSPGVIAKCPRFNTLFVSQHFVNYGGSQQGIATIMHRTRRTINRRLSRTKRVQIAKYHPTNAIERSIAAEEHSPEFGRFIKPSKQVRAIAKSTGKYDRRLEGYFRLLPCIYSPDYQLCSMKASRRDLKAIVRVLVDCSGVGVVNCGVNPFLLAGRLGLLVLGRCDRVWLSI